MSERARKVILKSANSGSAQRNKVRAQLCDQLRHKSLCDIEARNGLHWQIKSHKKPCDIIGLSSLMGGGGEVELGVWGGVRTERQ